MLRTMDFTYTDDRLFRFASIGIFALLIAAASGVEINFGGPVPFTLQVLVVLLAGLVLGARDGMLAVMVYLSLIALNFPVAAGGIGRTAFMGATTGYLIGFLPAAFVTGWLMERGAERIWQRWIAGIIGIMIIYGCGVIVLKAYFGMMQDGATWQQAWAWGVQPFIVLDLIKALLAAGLVETGRAYLLFQNR